MPIRDQPTSNVYTFKAIDWARLNLNLSELNPGVVWMVLINSKVPATTQMTTVHIGQLSL